MAKLDENYFIAGEKDIKSIKDLISEDEQILWTGKPKKSAFLLNAFFKMFPIAIIWLCFDGGFISVLIATGENFGGMTIFLIIFFMFHLLPVWIWLYNIIMANKKYKNIEYAFTNKRIIIKTGVIGIDFKSVYYSNINSVNLRVGLIDKMMKVGDIYINSTSNAVVIYDIEKPYFISQKLQEIVADIKSDIEFPNDLRPDSNGGYHTRYKDK